jgi:hypothetical protein
MTEQDVETKISEAPPTTASQEQPQQAQRPAEQMNGERAERAAPRIFDGRLPLRKPIIAHGDKVEEITFREPTGGDIEAIGVPVGLNLQIDGPTMTAMMAHLARVPPSAIRMMHAKDWSTGSYMLVGFFVPDAR